MAIAHREHARPPVLLGDRGLSLDELSAIARDGALVEIGEAARRAVRSSSAELARRLIGGERLYGVATGVGALDGVALPASDRAQASLVRSHAAGTGPLMEDEEVRAMMAARLGTLAMGASGASEALLDALAAMLNRGVTPVVPALGSVGASDLAPLAHMALVLCGEGRARFSSETLSGAEALRRAGMAPLELGARDGLALLNGLAQSTALAALAAEDAAAVIGAADIAGALGVVARAGLSSSFDERLAAARSSRGVRRSAARLRELLAGHRPGGALREPLSSRCMPEVHGAARDALAAARAAVERELRAPVDNPVVMGDGFVTCNAGHMHGQLLARRLDDLAAALTALASMSERRCALLLAGDCGLPPSLVHPADGPGSAGLMIAQYTAAAIVAEMRRRATPASVQSMPTCAGEDHASMSASAARHARWAVRSARSVAAIELLCACRAVELAGRELPAALAAVHQRVAAACAVGGAPAEGIEALGALVMRGL